MDKLPVIIFGAGGLGAAALDAFQSNGVVVYGFLDEEEELHGTEINYVSVLGNPDDDGFLKLIGKKCAAFVASDDNDYRESIVEMLNDRRKVMPSNAVHAQSMIAATAEIGHGNFVHMGAVVNSQAVLGNHCLIQPNAVVNYKAQLGDFVQVGAGSNIGASVQIGERAFIGSGVTVVSGVKIGKNARIGAGSVVIKDVAEGETVFGNPAQVVK
ncbi:acetyltransferase [Microscilla marina]|uniref:Pilin glycosylation protein n=1 Tax=Microscilla marina ATCC 23134 TaxID=313606 RepID=A1ZEB1_MICM2|nr:acetyltransferase [Microscilla marina]EAY31419.1 pilin glycosylation protein [Microscilla marina ATCC 23134]